MCMHTRTSTHMRVRLHPMVFMDLLAGIMLLQEASETASVHLHASGTVIT